MGEINWEMDEKTLKEFEVFKKKYGEQLPFGTSKSDDVLLEMFKRDKEAKNETK